MAKTKKTETANNAEGAVVADKPKKERAKRPTRVKFTIAKGVSDAEKVQHLYKLSIAARDQGQNPITLARTRTLLNAELSKVGQSVRCPESVLRVLLDISRSQMEQIVHEAGRLTSAVTGVQRITVACINDAAVRCNQQRFYPRHILTPKVSQE